MPDRRPWTERAYAALTGDHAVSGRDIGEKARGHVPANFLIQLLSASLTKFGDQCVNPKVVLPWIFQAGGVPSAFLGFLVPIREAFSMLPQLAAAAWLRTLSRRKGVWLLGTLLQGVMALGMSVAAVFLEGAALGWALLAAVWLFSLSRALCSVTSKEIVGKTVPKGRRGALGGIASSVSGLAAIALGAGAAAGAFTGAEGGWIRWLPAGGACTWFAASLLFLGLREPAGATEGGRDAIREALRGWRLPLEDHMFGRFLLCRALLTGTALVSPYLSALIYARSNNPLASLGGLMILSGAAALLSSTFWGRLSDRSSRAAMAAGGLVCAGTGAAVVGIFVLETPHIGWIGTGLYFLVQVGYYGVRMGRKTYVIDLPGAADRARYVAVSNTVMGLLLLAAGGLGAWLTRWGPLAPVAAFSGLALAGALACAGLRNVEAES